jgi:hypothetical protein
LNKNPGEFLNSTNWFFINQNTNKHISFPDIFCTFSMASLTQLKKPVGPTSAEVDERKELNKKQTKKESNGKTLNEEDKARLEYLKVKSKQFKRDMEEYEALTKELGVARRDQKVCC